MPGNTRRRQKLAEQRAAATGGGAQDVGRVVDHEVFISRIGDRCKTPEAMRGNCTGHRLENATDFDQGCPAGNTLSVNLPERIAHPEVDRCLELLATNPEQATILRDSAARFLRMRGLGGWKIVSVAGQALGYLANRRRFVCHSRQCRFRSSLTLCKTVTPDKRSAIPGPTRRASSLKRSH